ncbi:ABC transporter ATP-binding protein [Texcoconibacillus texcoconensis]|uniref:Heme exporter protein A n=1 Tax=Texcoconibacillus texcoconensis TaxID=1095777 RepID=A0A840QU17_9BACI|nr:ABC transporter ATP-binding protein [Texcoconibacillus texcoconensis]MBB5174803.1 heme exporter protein A [Texcoconibacillus texcoconensis]
MIETNGLSKTIGEKTIVRPINVSFQGAETVAILGPNGAGKSTFLNMIAGLIKPTSGLISFHGNALKKDDYTLKEKIGFLSHQSFLYDYFTPIENLIFFGRMYKVENVRERAKQLIDEVGLKLFQNEPVRSFSRGMLQRLAIARALIHNPEYLLLDEPHTGLDQQAVSILNEVIKARQKEGVTVLMVTHDFQQVTDTCTRALIMRNGRLVDDLSISELGQDTLDSRYQAVVKSS